MSVALPIQAIGASATDAHREWLSFIRLLQVYAPTQGAEVHAHCQTIARILRICGLRLCRRPLFATVRLPRS